MQSHLTDYDGKTSVGNDFGFLFKKQKQKTFFEYSKKQFFNTVKMQNWLLLEYKKT